MTNEPKPKLHPVAEFIIAFVAFLFSRPVLFILVCFFCFMWIKHPIMTPDEAVDYEKERLQVERQREEYERERIQMLGRVLQQSGAALTEQFNRGPAQFAGPAQNTNSNQMTNEPTGRND